jgi:LysM repeat protein
MHAWFKLACVVLAWTILPAGVITAGPGRSDHPIQASTRTTSVTRTTSISFTSARPAAAPAGAALAFAGAASAPARTYAVQRGDTLSAIATRFGVHGGWPALYAANRSVIGPDPDTLDVGLVLHLPGPATPVRYTVGAGDTLSGIAARFGVRGGWPVLYAANRSVIGPDPGRIQAGVRLTIPSPATPPASGQAPGSPRPGNPAPGSSAPGSSTPGLAQPHPQPKSPAPSAPSTAHQAHPRPHASTGMPSWLKTMLLAVGLLAVVIFAAEPLLVARRRRRRRIVVPAFPPHEPSQAPQDHQTHQANPAPEAPVMPVPAHPDRIKPARIVMADHDRLVITRSKRDDTICVLRPPGEDPADILRVARLVLPEGPYGTLAEQLGVPASWPMNQ